MKRSFFIAAFAAAIILMGYGNCTVHAETADSAVIKMGTEAGTVFLSLSVVPGAVQEGSCWLIESEGDLTLHLLDRGGNVALCALNQTEAGLCAETRYINPSPVMDAPAPEPLMASAAPADVQAQYVVPKRLRKLKNAPSFFCFEKGAKKLFRKSGLTYEGFSVNLHEGFVTVTATATNGVAVTWTYDGRTMEATHVSVTVP